MGYRSFRDHRGIDWQAWDVIPNLSERRLHERRTSRMSYDNERRVSRDRRVTPGRRPALHSGLGDGWLCFETTDEKRRLSPIPADWLACAVERLEQYLASAAPAYRIGSGTANPILGSRRD